MGYTQATPSEWGLRAIRLGTTQVAAAAFALSPYTLSANILGSVLLHGFMVNWDNYLSGALASGDVLFSFSMVRAAAVSQASGAIDIAGALVTAGLVQGNNFDKASWWVPAVQARRFILVRDTDGSTAHAVYSATTGTALGSTMWVGNATNNSRFAALSGVTPVTLNCSLTRGATTTGTINGLSVTAYASLYPGNVQGLDAQSIVEQDALCSQMILGYDLAGGSGTLGSKIAGLPLIV